MTPLIMILLVLCCCCLCCRKRPDAHNHHHNTHDSIPIATAVNMDASCPPPPENPVYTRTYGSTSSHLNHHGGGGGNVASGLGGFAIGAIVGDLIGRNAGEGHHHQNNVPMFGGGNDGGYDIIGDSGDNNYGGYDIQGDS